MEIKKIAREGETDLFEFIETEQVLTVSNEINFIKKSLGFDTLENLLSYKDEFLAKLIAVQTKIDLINSL